LLSEATCTHFKLMYGKVATRDNIMDQMRDRERENETDRHAYRQTYRQRQKCQSPIAQRHPWA